MELEMFLDMYKGTDIQAPIAHGVSRSSSDGDFDCDCSGGDLDCRDDW